ncbi:DUF4386 domain-containing protein [Actinopolyspora erythraea]|uniref:DUF4386 domain-containing protein n=1 Tax=Actinopolyspora erythraea TaxID=414996 RepID=A0A099DCB7_9ACTN|nr:hypothetical protein [Actinopolyspora erythraea]ASU77019.1 DUF4386 domain-containing protein [Actinopolyspora erythraea]KGI83015.1 hypothetical protein IL38_01420 [Actinopolyspora erythraea]
MSEPVESEARVRRFRTGSAGTIVLLGTALTVVSQFLQRRGDIPRGNPVGVFDHVLGTPWLAAALLGILGALCWAVAFPAAGRALRDPVSRVVARMADSLMVVAVALFAVNYAHDGFGGGMLARRWASGELEAGVAAGDFRVVEVLVGGTSVLSQALLGLALGGYALAMLRGRQYPRTLSWLGVVAATGWFLLGSALFLRLPWASFELLLPFAGLAMVWTLGVGITLLRSSAS